MKLVRIVLAYSMLCFLLAASTLAGSLPEVLPLPPGTWHAWQEATPEARAQHRLSLISPTEGPSLMMKALPDSPVTFHQYYQVVTGLQPGEVYEFSGLIRTEKCDTGVGAYLAIGALDQQGRRFMGNESGRIRGTSDWTFLRCALFVPPGVHSARLMLLLHGSGTAWFADLKLKRLQTWQFFSGGKVEVKIDTTPTTRNFFGFGVEDDCFFYTDENFRHGITPADIALRNQRIGELSPSLVATLPWWNSFCPSHDLDKLDFDTPLLRALVKTLRLHQRANRSVLLSDATWGWTRQQFPYSPANYEKGVRDYVALLRFLIQQKGLTCIKYVSVTAEVDNVFEAHGGTFDSYVKATRLFRRKLDEAGLQQVKVICDKSSGFAWFTQSVPKVDSSVQLFAIHEYPDITQYRLIDYRLQQALDVIHEYSRPLSGPYGKYYKPLFLWEIGYSDQAKHETDNKHSSMKTFDYGLLCANTAISALNKGLAGGSVWCLHSMYYPGQNRMDYGLWEFKDKGWRIRPVYYGYGLFTRFARRDYLPLQVEIAPKVAELSAGALARPDGKILLYLDNLSSKEALVTCHGLPAGRYVIYEYASERLPAPDKPGYGKLSSLIRGGYSPEAGPLSLRPRTLVLLVPAD